MALKASDHGEAVDLELLLTLPIYQAGLELQDLSLSGEAGDKTTPVHCFSGHRRT